MGKPLTISINALWAVVLALAPIFAGGIIAFSNWQSKDAVQAAAFAHTNETVKRLEDDLVFLDAKVDKEKERSQEWRERIEREVTRTAANVDWLCDEIKRRRNP